MRCVLIGGIRAMGLRPRSPVHKFHEFLHISITRFLRRTSSVHDLLFGIYKLGMAPN